MAVRLEMFAGGGFWSVGFEVLAARRVGASGVLRESSTAALIMLRL
jgi:hypothetical protein